ncbi:MULTISPECIES: type II toxin-antitoxin system death-on-curing family toxin [Rubrivirga]
MMTEPIWISRDLAEAIHQEQLREHGGRFGLRDENLLESALARPRQRWAYEDDVDLADLAAAYGFGIAKNHPFVDGNKRTAFMTLYSFLGSNGVWIETVEPEVVAVMLGVAAGELGEPELAAWCRDRGVPVSE